MMTQPVSVLSNLIASCHSLSLIPARLAAGESLTITLLFVAVSIGHSLILYGNQLFL
jgi:hypothetical protein